MTGPGPGPPIDYSSDEVSQMVIDLVGASFCTTAEWPDVTMLQRDLERRGEHLDLQTAIQWLDINLGSSANFPKATLTIRGLARYAGAQEDLANFVAALRLAYTRYASDLGSPTISRSDFLSPPLSLDALSLRKLFELLNTTYVAFNGGSGGADENWSRGVHAAIKDYRGVETIEDFLGVQSSLIPARYGPRQFAQEAREGRDKEVQVREDSDRMRETLRTEWARKAGGLAYYVALFLAVVLVWVLLIEPTIKGVVPQGALGLVVFGLLLGSDYLLGLNARNVSQIVRSRVARLMDRFLRRIQYPGEDAR